MRTEAARLRARLAEYYHGEGASAAVIIELPKGGYNPAFHVIDESPGRRKPSRLRARGFWLTAFSGLLLILAAGDWWFDHNSEHIRIAVLPLENLNHDPADDYLSTGLTGELIHNLAIIEGLEVRSQTSSFLVKGRSRNVQEAGRLLAVDYILEGSVLRDRGRLRLNAQLVRVQNDSTLWSGRFDREAGDIVSIQDAISREVVNHLRMKLGRGRRRYETSVEAYDYYLRASVGGLEQRIEALEHAIASDPSFAPAYARLAIIYAHRSVQFPLDHPAGEVAKMRAAAEKAMQLDPLLAEAHDALALADARAGRWAQAEEGFRRAIGLDSNRSSARDNYGYWLLFVLGRRQEALDQLHAALQSDPLSPQVTRDLTEVLLSLGRYQKAAEYCLRYRGDLPFKNENLARARFGQGRTAEAIRILADDPRSRSNPRTRGFLAYMYARSGRRDEAVAVAVSAQTANEEAVIFAGLGDRQRTLESLDRMGALGAQRLGIYLNYPEFALLRGDPKLPGLRWRFGLPG